MYNLVYHEILGVTKNTSQTTSQLILTIFLSLVGDQTNDRIFHLPWQRPSKTSLPKTHWYKTWQNKIILFYLCAQGDVFETHCEILTLQKERNSPVDRLG